jgi:hypothetical protein
MTAPERIKPIEIQKAVSGFNLPEEMGLDFVLSIHRSISLSWY